jgi:penicillin amidase
VRGRAAVPFVRRRTPSGPVLGTEPPPDPSADAGEVRVLALRWNGHEPSDELTAMLGVDRAQDWDGFLAAVSGFRSPEQNWVYADVDGNIGYAASGRIPVRRSGVGLLPTPGWTGEGRWERFLDADELPRAFNPPEGFLVTANNRVIGPEYPHLLSANFAPPHRAARIRAMILAGATLDAEAVRRMQMDTLDLFAAWARTLAAEAAAAVGADEEAALLRAWDGTAGADRREPALFWTWYRALRRLTFADEVGLRSGSVLEAWLRAGASPWFDDRTTPAREDLTALSRRAMREALEAVGTRRWGEIHVMRSDHALGAAGPLARLLRLNVGPAPRGGSSHTVNVADFGGDAPPFVNGFGPSFRQVVDLAAMDRAGVIITTGQTGHPLSRRYRDQAARWARGELWPLPLSGPHGASVATLRLESAEAKR